MNLYHGTSIDLLDEILKNGIAPRAKTQSKGNWPDAFTSHKDMVYLTTAYPFYFAIGAMQEEDTKCVVFEVSTDKMNEQRFYPDEDFIVQANDDLKNHSAYRRDIKEYQKAWLLSIQKLGNVSYKGGIAPRHIKRYCIFDLKERPNISMCFLDPAISILNYRFLGSYYRGLVAWMFGDQPDIPDKLGDLSTNGAPVFNAYAEHWKAEGQNRKGITVVDLTKGKE